MDLEMAGQGHHHLLMMLPNAATAIVEQRKIVDYLLNVAHPDNGGKAPFFHLMGFDALNWSQLSDALKELALNGTVVDMVQSAHGCKYVVDGPLPTPGGKRPRVRTIWSVDLGTDRPRLVTAYPRKLRVTP
jgi:hypothetical protein